MSAKKCRVTPGSPESAGISMNVIQVSLPPTQEDVLKVQHVPVHVVPTHEGEIGFPPPEDEVSGSSTFRHGNGD